MENLKLLDEDVQSITLEPIPKSKNWDLIYTKKNSKAKHILYKNLSYIQAVNYGCFYFDVIAKRK